VLDLSEAALAKAQNEACRRRRQGEMDRCRRHHMAARRALRHLARPRAFHFLAAPDAQRAYVARLKLALRGGGHAIIATFALDGPKKCSGLPVTRHSAETIGALLGLEFALIDTRRHQHLTPWGSVQKFQFSTFMRVVDKSARATSLQSSDATAPREAMSRPQLLDK
jgi:hypothetical protein